MQPKFAAFFQLNSSFILRASQSLILRGSTLSVNPYIRFKKRHVTYGRSIFPRPTPHIPPSPTVHGSYRRLLTMLDSKDKVSANKDEEAMLAKGRLIKEKLEELYPIAPKGFLNYTDEFTLLVAVVLSAQSLDLKVNEVTPELFRQGGTPAKMRALGAEKIRTLIQKVGLAPQKAKNIAKLSATLCDEHDGEVPSTFEELEKLAGVGHKTASVVMIQAFNKPAFPVDTHIHRLACRWGCGEARSVDKTEAALKRWFPSPEDWGDLHVRIILFGREYCPARGHDMQACPICCFARTEEAWRANESNPKKFVAAVRHQNPFSVREVVEGEGMGNKLEGKKKNSGSKSGKRKGRGKKEKMNEEETDEDDSAVEAVEIVKSGLKRGTKRKRRERREIEKGKVLVKKGPRINSTDNIESGDTKEKEQDKDMDEKKLVPRLRRPGLRKRKEESVEG